MNKTFKYFPTGRRLRITLFVLLLFILFYLFYSSTNDTIHSLSDHQINTDTVARTVSFDEQVKPILNKRCVVCHSCFDAPCQLKLSSVTGILRGASKEKVYNPNRIKSIPPTRLFIDAKTEDAWREKGFHSVVDNPTENPKDNTASLMQMLLELKQHHPQPDKGKLPGEFTLDLDRDQKCVANNLFDKYAKKHPLWGMPYAMPNLSHSENDILTNWLKNGAPMPASRKLNSETQARIKKWEKFLNQPFNKHRLVSRYLYEHLFHAHIHFKDTPGNEFYRLVRSTTAPSNPIDEIATLRPYDDPGSEKFYYRLLPYAPVIVAKNHIVYEFSAERIQRYTELFITPDYRVDKLPSYSASIASNPFKAYAPIPPNSRYRFLLDDARFFIEGFVKGPVCRGQIALNVIEDQFWIVFFNPDQDIFTTQADFLNNMSDYLRIPSERKSHLNFLHIWTDYWQRQKKYMASKQRYFKKMQSHSLDHALSYIWNGNGTNPNAALTVFRHFDSASVEYGFVGKEPETAWVIDYPLFERIHYLLVAGFNVYGNVVHQLSTRIYMDFLRMEGEDHFLVFLPVKQRKIIRDSWYQGMRTELDALFKAPMGWIDIKSVTGYRTEDVQSELYHHIKQRLGNLLQQEKRINQCGDTNCSRQLTSTDKNKMDATMNKLTSISGSKLHTFPEVSFVRVTTDDSEQSFGYSIIRNKAYKNVVTLLSDERKRDQQDIEKDNLTVVDWLLGNYPNFFFSVNEKDLNLFVELCSSLEKQQDFDTLIERFGIRRTNPLFWENADWFQAQYKLQRPVHSGLFDLSRYSNL